jgi:hypothetical protein
MLSAILGNPSPPGSNSNMNLSSTPDGISNPATSPTWNNNNLMMQSGNNSQDLNRYGASNTPNAMDFATASPMTPLLARTLSNGSASFGGLNQQPQSFLPQAQPLRTNLSGDSRPASPPSTSIASPITHTSLGTPLTSYSPELVRMNNSNGALQGTGNGNTSKNGAGINGASNAGTIAYNSVTKPFDYTEGYHFMMKFLHDQYVFPLPSAILVTLLIISSTE